MKKIFIAIVALGIMIPAVAQIAQKQTAQHVKKAPVEKEVRKRSQITPEHYSQRKVEALDAHLSLTENQKKEIYNIVFENAPQRIGAIGNDATTISAINEAENAKISKVLTAEQNKKLEDSRNEKLSNNRAHAERRGMIKRTTDETTGESRSIRNDLEK